MFHKSAVGDLFVPRVVCIVDTDKCIGCGQCQELCDCGGIGLEEGPGGGLPRIVDPMVCTGGGTCAAACPYHALVLQNNSNDQREARVSALARRLGPDECMAFVCGSYFKPCLPAM
ncbi:MAG: 4Fe-4S binding protein, partial [Desulfobacterales bacterium]